MGLIDVKILNYAYTNREKGPVLLLSCRDVKLKKHILQVHDPENLAPTFGILQHELSIAKDMPEIINIEPGPDSLFNEKTLLCNTIFPWEVGRVRNEFDWTFQADVKWEKMAMSKIVYLCGLESPYIRVPSDYMWDYLKVKDIENVPEDERFDCQSRICDWDIETDTRKVLKFSGFKDADISPIISITAYDNYTNEYHQFVWRSDLENVVENHKNWVVKDEATQREVTIENLIVHKYIKEEDSLKGFFDYFSRCKFDDILGYFSEGGMKKQSFKGRMKRTWVNGFDMPFLYKRCQHLDLLEEIQQLSPFPKVRRGRGWANVYIRGGRDGKTQVVAMGLGQLDWIFSNEVLQIDQKYYDFRGNRLKDWMNFFLDFNKLDKSGKPVGQLWEEDLRYMLDYNLIDVYGLVELDKKFNLSGVQRGRAEVSISPIEDGIFASKLHDHAKLTHYQMDYAFDTKYYGGVKKRTQLSSKTGKIKEKFHLRLNDLKGKPDVLEDVDKVGGHVAPILERGVYTNVATIDFSKFYPNAIKSSNAGITTAIDFNFETEGFVHDMNNNAWDKKGLIETPCGYFRKDIKSLNSLIFDRWIGLRLIAQKKLKDYVSEFKTTKTNEYNKLWTEQFNRKNFTNAGFGVFGLEIDRNYSRLVFNSCTMMCQDIMKFVLNKLHEWGFKIIGGDTDSCFIILPWSELTKCIAKSKELCTDLDVLIGIYLNKVYNIQKHTIHIGLETISDKFYVDVKKHYIKRNLYADGEILAEPELEIKGMDLKKRATSAISANLQRFLINCIFKEDNPIEAITDFLVDLDKNLEEYDWSFVCKRGALNKPLKDYPDTNQSATAARNAVKYLGHEFKPGDNPYLGVFKDHPSQLNGKFVVGNGRLVLSFYKEDIEFLMEKGFILDYDNIRETQLFKKSEHLLEIFGEDYYSIVEGAMEGDFLAI